MATRAGCRAASANMQTPYPYAGTMAGALGGAIGSAMASAIFGSAEKRRARRVNMRTCMHFKGYDRFGLPKSVWDGFNFEEGLSSVADDKRLTHAEAAGTGRFDRQAAGQGAGPVKAACWPRRSLLSLPRRSPRRTRIPCSSSRRRGQGQAGGDARSGEGLHPDAQRGADADVPDETADRGGRCRVRAHAGGCADESTRASTSRSSPPTNAT